MAPVSDVRSLGTIRICYHDGRHNILWRERLGSVGIGPVILELIGADLHLGIGCPGLTVTPASVIDKRHPHLIVVTSGQPKSQTGSSDSKEGGLIDMLHIAVLLDERLDGI